MNYKYIDFNPLLERRSNDDEKKRKENSASDLLWLDTGRSPKVLTEEVTRLTGGVWCANVPAYIRLCHNTLIFLQCHDFYPALLLRVIQVGLS